MSFLVCKVILKCEIHICGYNIWGGNENGGYFKILVNFAFHIGSQIPKSDCVAMFIILLVSLWLSSLDVPFNRAISWVLTFFFSLTKISKCWIIIHVLINVLLSDSLIYVCNWGPVSYNVVLWILFGRSCPPTAHEMNFTMSFLLFLFQSVWLLLLMLLFCSRF